MRRRGFTEIKLTDRQFEIVKSIFATKARIQDEINLVSQRETEFIVNLCEAVGVPIAAGIQFEGQSMFVPTSIDTKEQEKPKKSKVK